MYQTIKYIVVDDEPMAIDVIRDYAHKLSFLEEIGVFRDAIACMDFLQENEVDLIFLDINMPDVTGIDMLKSIHTNAMVVFTTAYREYAIEGYNFNSIGYLLKPINFQNFLNAVNKARTFFSERTVKTKQQGEAKDKVVESKNEMIWVKSGTDYIQLKLQSIMFIKGEGNYVVYYTENEEKVMVLNSLNKLEKELPGGWFQRVHKSYILNTEHIEKLERHQVSIKEHKIPIGISYRKQIFDYLNIKR